VLCLVLCFVALLFWFARPLCALSGCTFVLYLARAAVRFRTTLHELRRCLLHRGVPVSWFCGFVRTPLARATAAGDAYVCARGLVGWVKVGTSI